MNPLDSDPRLPVPPLAMPRRPSSRAPAHAPPRAAGLAAALAAVAAMLSACATPSTQPGLSDLIARPAERALMLGLRSYDDAQYAEAEKQFQAALRAGLGSARDQANAHKHLAFIFCTSERLEACEEAFRAARRADAAFALTRSESGHPLWGPVYRRVLP